MSFANQLKRLKEAAMRSIPGCPPGKVTVDVRDLQELLRHFDRIDAEVRLLHQLSLQPIPLPTVLDEIAAERRRQVEEERCTPEQDDRYGNGELATVAGYYALASGWPHQRDIGRGHLPQYWPASWCQTWWKPTNARRNLVKSAALAVAAIESLDRQAKKNGG